MKTNVERIAIWNRQSHGAARHFSSINSIGIIADDISTLLLDNDGRTGYCCLCQKVIIHCSFDPNSNVAERFVKVKEMLVSILIGLTTLVRAKSIDWEPLNIALITPKNFFLPPNSKVSSLRRIRNLQLHCSEILNF